MCSGTIKQRKVLSSPFFGGQQIGQCIRACNSVGACPVFRESLYQSFHSLCVSMNCHRYISCVCMCLNCVPPPPPPPPPHPLSRCFDVSQWHIIFYNLMFLCLLYLTHYCVPSQDWKALPTSGQSCCPQTGSGVAGDGSQASGCSHGNQVSRRVSGAWVREHLFERLESRNLRFVLS